MITINVITRKTGQTMIAHIQDPSEASKFIQFYRQRKNKYIAIYPDKKGK